jgi:phytoene synthase
VTVEAAYAACRVIAKREAKNFYYSFRVLPPAKSDAMCAVYAFMRKADDLADDESITLEARRIAMAAWLAAWRAARSGGPTDDPVFIALSDAQKRFSISDQLLEDLVRGTTLDLEAEQPGVTAVTVTKRTDDGEETATYQVYETFDALYRYCYLVASVVGLVCIKVFGYTDPAAEKLAEETGIAFQLTNILRDVKEDADRGRIYLPMDDMRSSGADVEQIVIATEQGIVGHGVRILTVREGKRAKSYYASAEKLLPMIDPDSRAALWVMVSIYRKLLEKIAAKGYPLSTRVSLSTTQKLWVLAQGAMMARRLKGPR